MIRRSSQYQSGLQFPIEFSAMTPLWFEVLFSPTRKVFLTYILNIVMLIFVTRTCRFFSILNCFLCCSTRSVNRAVVDITWVKWKMAFQCPSCFRLPPFIIFALFLMGPALSSIGGVMIVKSCVPMWLVTSLIASVWASNDFWLPIHSFA